MILERYELENGVMESDPDGDYVKYVDHALEMRRVFSERNRYKAGVAVLAIHINSLLGFLDGFPLPLGFQSLAQQAQDAIKRERGAGDEKSD